MTVYNKIGNFSDHTEHIIGLYCGDRVPSTLTLKNSAMIIFSTDMTSTRDGFEILYDLQGKCMTFLQRSNRNKHFKTSFKGHLTKKGYFKKSNMENNPMFLTSQ